MRKISVLIATLFFPALVFAQAKIALVQYDADLHFAQTNYNTQRLTEFAKEAALNGAKLIVFPEGSSHGYADPNASSKRLWCLKPSTECRSVAEVAEELSSPGPVLKHWLNFAKENSVTVVVSLIEKRDTKYFNSAVTVGPQGIIATYRKRALYYIDEYYASSGTAPTVVDLGFGKVGFLICADGNNGSYFQELKRLGADTIILTMDWDQSPDDQSTRSAKNFFSAQAKRHGLGILASDVSRWDGTGYYTPAGKRIRYGLPEKAVGKDGITYVELE